MSKITWHNETRKVKDLLPADYNPRAMSEKERQDLLESVEEFDAVVPVVINIGKRENILIGGHQRVEIYGMLNIEEIDVRVPNRELTLAEEKRLNLRLNKNTGHFVGDKLKELGIDLLIEVGFGEEELTGMFDDVDVLDDSFDVEKKIKEIKTPKTAPGDLWQLGDHRLMVGDSTDPEQVKKLMGGAKADMIYCDPPYNIGLDYTKGIGQKANYGGNYTAKKDSKNNDDYKTFVGKTIANALENAKKDVHVFYWCDERYIWVFQTIYAEQAVESHRVCLWIKQSANPTPQIAFSKVYEPCVYGKRGKPYLNRDIKNLSEIMNKEVEGGNQGFDEIFSYVNLWLQKRDTTQDYEHPTQKPVTLHERPLKRCTAPGHVVIDLFGGSGSTLISCEQLKRKAYLMEQDPIFATVIIERWEAWTGGKAKKIK